VSVWTHSRVHADAATSPHGRIFLPSAWTVKTRPRVKCIRRVNADARGRPDDIRGRSERPDGKFYRRTSI
jgi:hypothetical protein